MKMKTNSYDFSKEFNAVEYKSTTFYRLKNKTPADHNRGKGIWTTFSDPFTFSN
jgi:hypothetical protein